MKMPFRENLLLDRNAHKVKIVRIFTDATTKDVLQISVDVINEGFEAHEFVIAISNCPVTCGSSAKTSTKKVLLPHVGQTLTFLMPLFSEQNKNKIQNCEGS